MVNAHGAFSIRYLWSAMVLFMPERVYGFSTGDKLLICAVACPVGALVRIPYALAANWFGGRDWTIFSALVLVIPIVGTIGLTTHPGNYSASLVLVDRLFRNASNGSRWA